MNTNLERLFIEKLLENERMEYFERLEHEEDITFRFNRTNDEVRKILINNFNQDKYLVNNSDSFDIYIKGNKLLISYFDDCESLEWDIRLLPTSINCIENLLSNLIIFSTLDKLEDDLCRYERKFKLAELDELCDKEVETDSILYVKDDELLNLETDGKNNYIYCKMKGLKLKISFKFNDDMLFTKSIFDGTISLKSIDYVG